MPFDFGAALTSAGDIQPALQAQRQKELEQSQQQQAFATQQKTAGLQNDALERQKQGWVKQRSYSNSAGESHSIYLTPQGYQDVVDSPDYPTVAEQLSRSGLTEKTADPEVLETFRLLSTGIPPAQAASLAKGRPVLKPYQLPDKSIQYFDASRPDLIPEGVTAYESAANKPQTPDVRYLAVEQKKASGQPLDADDIAFEKGYKQLIQTKTTDPGVARMTALAQSRIVTPVDPDNPTAEIYDTAGDAMRKGLNAPGSINYKMMLPTASERQRADFALSAHEQLGDMTKILSSRADLFGPASGRYTDFTQWIGSQDPDAQRFRTAARVLSDHAIAVFGARSQYASESVYQLVGQNATNPQAAAAGLQQLDKALETIGGRGVGPNAPGSGAAALGNGKGSISLVRARSLPEFKGKSDAAITQAAKLLGYEVKP